MKLHPLRAKRQITLSCGMPKNAFGRSKKWNIWVT
jgi:hypothetical protein